MLTPFLVFIHESFLHFATPFPTLYQPGINIAHNARGHDGKIQSKLLANHSVLWLQALAI